MQAERQGEHEGKPYSQESGEDKSPEDSPYGGTDQFADPSLPLISPEDTMAWLQANYEYHPEALVQREALNAAFAAHCASTGLRPRQAAALGKIIKSVFAEVSYRRLGKRGSNKMHYYHMRAKDQPPDEQQAQKAYRRRRKGEAEDMSLLMGNSPEQRNIVLTWGPDDRAGQKAESSKRKRVEGTTAVHAVIPAGPARGGSPPGLAFRSADVGLAFDSHILQFRNTYRREYWALSPTNPASLKSKFIRSVIINGDSEKSSLSFSCLVMLSIANFVSENWDQAQDLFYQARDHLGAVFDKTDYDVACALVPFTWFFHFYSDRAEQGHYYATLGVNMCEQLGAYNDTAYLRLTWLLSFGGPEEDAGPVLAKARQQPPYKRSWKPLKKELRLDNSAVHMELSKVDGVLYHCVDSLAERPLGAEERLRILDTLKDQLTVLALLEVEIDLARTTGSFPSGMSYDMMMCQLYGQRALILSMLDSPHRLDAAETFINLLLRVGRPAMLIALRSRPRNDLLLSNAFKVLIWYQRLEPLERFLAVIKPLARRYSWLESLRVGIKLAMFMAHPTAPSSSSSHAAGVVIDDDRYAPAASTADQGEPRLGWSSTSVPPPSPSGESSSQPEFSSPSPSLVVEPMPGLWDQGGALAALISQDDGFLADDPDLRSLLASPVVVHQPQHQLHRQDFPDLATPPFTTMVPDVPDLLSFGEDAAGEGEESSNDDCGRGEWFRTPNDLNAVFSSRPAQQARVAPPTQPVASSSSFSSSIESSPDYYSLWTGDL